jgi:hypothetical protein
MKCDIQSGYFGYIRFLGTAEQMGDVTAAQAFFGSRMVPLRKSAGASKRRKRRARNRVGLIQAGENRDRIAASPAKAKYIPMYCGIQANGKFLMQKARKFTNQKNAGRYKTNLKGSRHIACRVSLLDAMFVADHHYLQHYKERLYFRDDEATADFSTLPVQTIDVEEMKAQILVVTNKWYGQGAFMPECSIITAIKDASVDSEWQAINMGHTQQNRFTEPESGHVKKYITPNKAKDKIKDSTCESPVQLRFCNLNGSKYCKGVKDWLQKKVQEECVKIFWQQ